MKRFYAFNSNNTRAAACTAEAFCRSSASFCSQVRIIMDTILLVSIFVIPVIISILIHLIDFIEHIAVPL